MKSKVPKEIRERREKSRSKTKKAARKRFHFDWKFWVGVLIALASLLLAVIALGPVVLAVPNVSVGTPLNPADVLTTPIEISNSGWLDLKDVTVETYIRKLEYRERPNWKVNDIIVSNYFSPSPILAAGESKTVPFANVINLNSPLAGADVALIVFYRERYRPSFLPSRRKPFRFVTGQQSNGNLIPLKQPAEDTLERYDALRGRLGIR